MPSMGTGTGAAAGVEHTHMATPQSVRTAIASVLNQDTLATFDAEVARAAATIRDTGDITELQQVLDLWSLVIERAVTPSSDTELLSSDDQIRQRLGV